jgi:proton-translocating NAD(P)+ transhydrogenase subunit alpha
MPPLSVLAIKELGPDERRVALVPESVPRLQKLGLEVLVEAGAGASAWMPDEAYDQAGAVVVPPAEAYGRADIVVTVGTLSPTQIEKLREGQVVIGLLRPLTDQKTVGDLAARGVTAVSLDALPRTLSRAQTMDALTSQANVAGYKAAIVAADTFGRYFPLLITAAGTSRPASVLVLGAGVAGLQAMGTARRLGAVVTGYDVRPETREEIQSVGARFLDLQSVESAAGEGGYARELSDTERATQQAELESQTSKFDVVITTAQVPGRRPPVLVTAEAIKHMRPGSVVVDLAASGEGGNVEGSVPNETVTTENGVVIIGAGNLPAQVPGAASVSYSNNVTALLADFIQDGALNIDFADEIQAAVVVTHEGKVRVQ